MGESVWDYPRPPIVVATDKPVRLELGGGTIAESHRALRVLEASSPPTIYIPVEDFADGVLVPAEDNRPTVCEFKGQANYYDLVANGSRAVRAAWGYAEPNQGYEQLLGHVSVYPGRVDGAYLDGERARPQSGDFYGGWITDDVEGPFKGDPGTEHW